MTRAPLARRGYLGFEVELDDAGGPPGRLVVGRVDEGSPAARGGVQVGDVLVAIAGQPVIDLRAARSLAARLPAGQGAELGFLRDGHPIALAVDVEPMPLEPLANGRVELGEVLVLQEDGGS
ncbi:MAG TPA: PDZ domain-containing protein, partial [Polyangiaceae bacterium]|nr:PDZ domain-containing protein [Polyangiaceae bacterium]